jgi:hypothetical protein
MELDLWYDLAVLEMSERSDPGKERLVEAEQDRLPPEPPTEEGPGPKVSEPA